MVQHLAAVQAPRRLSVVLVWYAIEDKMAAATMNHRQSDNSVLPAARMADISAQLDDLGILERELALACHPADNCADSVLLAPSPEACERRCAAPSCMQISLVILALRRLAAVL